MMDDGISVVAAADAVSVLYRHLCMYIIIITVDDEENLSLVRQSSPAFKIYDGRPDPTVCRSETRSKILC